MSDKTAIPQEICEDAAEWFGRLETERPSDAIRAEFVQWLTRSPVHIDEFLRVAALHHALSRELRADPEWLEGVLAEATAADDNVVWMNEPRTSAASERSARTRGIRLLWKVAAVLLAAAGVAAVVKLTGLTVPGRGDRFATAVGEQRQVALPDGSSVLLNTDTEIRVRMSRELRQVELRRGEAIFDVEKDPARPFRVVSDTAAVQAIGTRFVVYRQEQQTIVVVVEGRVSVSPVGRVTTAASRSTSAADSQGRAAARPADAEPTPAHRTVRTVELDAGQRVTVAPDGTVAEPVMTDVEAATSWTRGRMVFDSATLRTVVAEFNRYNVKRLVISDAALGDRRITGVFNIGDPETFLSLLSDLGKVRVDRTVENPREIRLEPAGDSATDHGSSPSPAADLR